MLSVTKKLTLATLLTALCAASVFAQAEKNTAETHLAKARALYDNQIYISAISEARLQLKETPSNIDTWMFIAQVYMDMKKYQDAMDASLSALKYAPGNSAVENMVEKSAKARGECPSCQPAKLLIGRAYMQAKAYGKAIDAYRSYLKANPSDQQVRLELARMLSWEKEYSASAGEYEAFLRKHPSHTQALLELADVYSWSNNLPLAESRLKAALSSIPNDAAVHAKLGNVFEWQGKFQEAKAEYTVTLEISSSNDVAKKGLKRIKSAEDKAAFLDTPAGMEDTIKKTHNYALYLRLADVQYQDQNKKEEALANYRRYLQAFPDDYDAKLKVARVFSWEKMYTDAMALYNVYIDRFPNDSYARIEMANILAWQGHGNEALAQLDVVRKKKPTMPAVWLASGNIYKWQGSYGLARRDYHKTLELDPDNVDAKNGLAEIEREFPIKPEVYLRNSNIIASDINYSRMSFDFGGKFHLFDGQYELSPGVKTHRFKQSDTRVNAQETYLEGSGYIKSMWRWFGTASYFNIQNYTNKMQVKAGVSASVSTTTWISAYYISQDAVFDTNNLSAILAEKNINMDSFNGEMVHKITPENEISGFMSEATFSDGNSRTRVNLRFLHQLYEVPMVKVGGAYKLLSYSNTSTYYWAPSSYSGMSFIGSIGNNIDDFSYRLGLEICRIMDSSQTESSVEGELMYRPKGDFFAGLTFGLGRGGGSMVDGTNSVFKTLMLQMGYSF